MPEKYFEDGLWTKQVGSGDDPEPHKKYGWMRTISNHIHFRNEEEKFIYDTNAFLSFSLSRSIALSFIGGTKNRPFDASVRESADAFLFTFNFEDSDLQEIGDGVYTFEYTCNYGRGSTDPDFYSFIGSFCRCNICENFPGYRHKLLLIDAEEFLSGVQDDFPEEHLKAYWDKEWLLLPADPMMDPSGIGFQSKIAIADFWAIEFFKYTG